MTCSLVPMQSSTYAAIVACSYSTNNAPRRYSYCNRRQLGWQHFCIPVCGFLGISPLNELHRANKFWICLSFCLTRLRLGACCAPASSINWLMTVCDLISYHPTMDAWVHLQKKAFNSIWQFVISYYGMHELISRKFELISWELISWELISWELISRELISGDDPDRVLVLVVVFFAECASCVQTFSREFDLQYDSKIIVKSELSQTVKHHPMPRHQICSLPGCSSRSDRRECEGVKFHRLPQDPDQRDRC